MPWKPPPSQASYYAVPAPSSQQWVLPQLLRPVLGTVGTVKDRTYGRATLPFSPDEEKIRQTYEARDEIVTMKVGGSKAGKDEAGKDGAGKEKAQENEKEQDVVIKYQIWSNKKESGVKDKGSDLLFIHGINDYGGKFSMHASRFLDEGYRIVLPDLPSHGRSTGIHVYLTDLDILADAVYTVLGDILEKDGAASTAASPAPKTEPDSKAAQPQLRRKVFVAGQSLGGFVAVLTCLKYGSPKDTTLPVDEDFRPEITGGIFLCPMLAISTDSRPHWTIEAIARGISYFAGVLPLAAANKGKNSEDPEVEEMFQLDPQTYHGKLRVGTGLAILKAITELNELLPHLKVPFSIHHGTGDRVTSYHGSEKLYEQAASKDKQIKLYEGYEHILMRKGRDENDDLRRQKVLTDMLDWLNRH